MSDNLIYNQRQTSDIPISHCRHLCFPNISVYSLQESHRKLFGFDSLHDGGISTVVLPLLE